MVKIAPSILSADYTELSRQVLLAEKGGADLFHIDIMDGHFVPNITVGPVIVNAMRRCTRRPLDVHLMIEHPERMIKRFSDAGADIITVHIEAAHDVRKTIRLIEDEGKSPGIVLNPPTPFKKAVPFLEDVDLLLIMTVVPGFAGQKFMPELLPKIKKARRYIVKEKIEAELEVDGGINLQTASKATSAGADILVAGSAIFGGNIVKVLLAQGNNMEETSRKTLYFFMGIIVPMILIGVSFLPTYGNILLTMVALVWLGFAILMLSPAET
jgi:ribulose-phosphate 3-epimerase